MRSILFFALALSAFSATAAKFEASSPDIPAGQLIPQDYVYNGFGCTGNNVSPAINWKNPPKGTLSFAVTMHDPDAPTGGAGFWHWMVVNLPDTMTGLARGDGELNSPHLPKGAIQIRNDYGQAAWGGPCPPVGDKPHRYNFTVYALRTNQFVIPPGASASYVGFMLNSHAIALARFTALYGRK
ncbi:MAG: YbhB/YbcL family Raf kinase inhibitor-like protein [Sulfuriferula sp.]